MKSISEFFDFQPADWDTAYFDVKSAKLTLHNAIDQADFQKIKALAAEYRFITITNMDNNPSNNLWISRLGGAFLADVRIEFKRTTGDLPPAPDSRIHIIDGMERNSDVQRIAASSFIHSRFYNDPFLDSAKTKSIYETWVNNAFGKKGRFFCLWEEERRILGFLLFSHLDDGKGITVELIAADADCTHRGVGRAMMNGLFHYTAQNGAEYISVGTQLNNLAAQNFYTSCGFRLTGCHSIYHLWPSEADGFKSAD